MGINLHLTSVQITYRLKIKRGPVLSAARTSRLLMSSSRRLCWENQVTLVPEMLNQIAEHRILMQDNDIQLTAAGRSQTATILQQYSITTSKP